ncbi:dihydrodipicolinate synthase family protein [Cyclobacterium roseum]|uniref:dihydrodipicolinate synthase family protein n=1 Tax=Cyclobacterium roseum TaxID=2666137 RepID=UPI0013907FE6|nr:dihydrodipicolinate synthase family protein [Cyclobacterium roseum]
MDPLKSNEIFGTWATLLLPILPDQSIDYNLLEEEIDHLIQSGVNGIYTNGTAGEFYSQTATEFNAISTLLAEKCEQAKLPFQIGCSHMDALICLDRIRMAKGHDPSAIQIILPDWFPPSQKELLLFLERMALAASPIGLVLYNPPHAKKQLVPEDYRVLLSEGLPVVGCKVLGGEEEWYTEMADLMLKISIFVPGHRLASGLSMGAHGSYSNMACLNPDMAQKWYHMMVNDMEKALDLEIRINEFLGKYILPYSTEKGYSSAALDKFLAAIGGWLDIGTALKWPYLGIPFSEVKKVRERGKRDLPEFIL